MTEKLKRTRAFTSGILFKDGKILIMKRGSAAPTYPNVWDNLGGHLIERESAEECMIREAKEECGLDVRIKKTGKVYEYVDKYGRSVVIPYLLESDSNKVKLSFEHTEYKWVEPEELKNLECVPDIIEDCKVFGLLK
jgi:8-oxo-dGTP diphosphatase